jgi:outer membrane protein assembly factor BamB
VNIQSWAAALCVAVLAAGCGGGGGDGKSDPPISVSISPSSATLTATNTGASPSAYLGLSATNMPSGGLYVMVDNGSRGYVTAGFDGTDLIVTGDTPASLAIGTYTDPLDVKVCYDDTCKRQISGSPFRVPVRYTITQGTPAIETPTISRLSPSSAVAGGAGFTLSLSGNDFAPTSLVLWNGQVRATTYVSASTLSAQVNASDIASIASASVTVSNASTGGGVSFGQTFLVTAPVPVLASLAPASAATRGSAYMLTVNGTGFDSTAQVAWNGSARTTLYLSASKLTAQVTAADIAVAGSFPVTVANQYGTGVSSNAIAVTVADAPLTLASLVPAFVAAGGPAYVQTLVGTGFDATSAAQWNGSPRATTLVSSTQLKVQVGAADIASVGSASLQVVNTGANAGTSAAQSLTIGLPSTDATAFQINPQHNGAIRFATIVGPTALPPAPTWTATLDGTASYPLIAGGRVFVTVARTNGAGSEIVALSAATGAVVWGPVAVSGSANATYDNGRVIVLSGGFGPGILTGLDAATGTQLWSTALTSQYMFTAPPTALNGMVFTGGAGSGGTLYGVDDTSGALMWQAGVMNGDASSPTLTADGVYVTYPCQTYDFNPLTGALNWNNSNGCEGGGGATGTYANGTYFSPNNTGYSGMSFDAETGNVLGSYTASQPPAVSATTGYFLQSGTLSAIGLSNNVIKWTFAGDGSLATAPILVNGYLFIASGSGKLYALDAATGALLLQTTLAGANGGNGNPSGLSAGGGLLLVPAGSTLSAYTLSDNP